MASDPDEGQDSKQNLDGDSDNVRPEKQPGDREDSDKGRNTPGDHKGPPFSTQPPSPLRRGVSYFQDLGYGPAAADHESLREVILQLPEQYITVITHPWTGVFFAEKRKANWDIVWIQLLANAIIAGVLGFLSTLIPFAAPGNAPSNSIGIQSPNVVHALNLSTTIGLIVFIPAIFFIGSGILRLIVKGFGGFGSFLEQCYTTLLFQVPFGVALSVIRLLPFIGGFFFWFGGLVLLVYGIVLQILATMVVHDLPSNKAISAVIITVIILIPVTIMLLAFLTFIFAFSLHTA